MFSGILGGAQNASPEAMARQRQIAKLLAQKSEAPAQTLGAGIGAAAGSIGDAMTMRHLLQPAARPAEGMEGPPAMPELPPQANAQGVPFVPDTAGAVGGGMAAAPATMAELDPMAMATMMGGLPRNAKAMGRGRM